MQLSSKLTRLIAKRNLTQESLGDALGIAHTTVGRWLSGKSRPYVRVMHQLADYFQLPVEVLLDDAEELPPLAESEPRDYAVAEEGEPLPATPVLRLVRRLDKLAAEVVEIRGELADLAAEHMPAAGRGRALVPVTLPSQTQQLSSVTGKPIPRSSRGVRSA